MKNRVIVCSFLLATIGVTLSACDITRYTTDTVSRFTATTSPGSAFTADGTLKQEKKALFFIAVNAENLRHDISQGEGEYLTSLSTLLNIPVNRQNDFYRLAQEQYADLYPSDNTTPTQTLTALLSAWSR